MIVKIKEITPGATYQGEVFTQTVVVQLQNGTNLRLEDPSMQCSRDYIGNNVEISINADIAESVEVTSDDTIVLVPVDPETGPGIERLRTVIQKIVAVEGSQTTVVLAIPTGELSFTFNSTQLPKNLPTDYEPAVGDSLQFEGISNVVVETISEVTE